MQAVDLQFGTMLPGEGLFEWPIARAADGPPVDMGEVPFMSSSGLMALHSIALLMRGEEPPDPEHGWSAFHSMGREVKGGGVQDRVKLENVQPRVERALQMARFDQYFEHYADLDEAVASF